jgi:hypothetical protein
MVAPVKWVCYTLRQEEIPIFEKHRTKNKRKRYGIRKYFHTVRSCYLQRNCKIVTRSDNKDINFEIFISDIDISYENFAFISFSNFMYIMFVHLFSLIV